MSEWADEPLGSLVAFQKGRKVDTASQRLPGFERYLGASGILGLPDGYASTTRAVKATEPDVLMLWDGERSGLVGRGQTGVVASTVSRLSIRGSVDSEYLYYALAHQFEWIQNRRTGSGVPHVPKEIGRILRVRFPRSPDSQKRIAAVLKGLDSAIAAAEGLINKHQQLKAGLMHDLFTRGVLPLGDLRPSHREQPSAYRPTSVGPLPLEWKVETLANLLAPVANNIRSGPFGSALLKDELSESGVPLLGIDNIHVERFERSYTRFVSNRKFAALARYRVRPGDVVITIMGTVGRCCVLPQDIGVALSSKHLWTMTLDAERVLADLVCWQLNHAPWARAWFRRGSQGGIMDAIQSTTLKSLLLPLPPIGEQLRIQDRYSTIQAGIQSEADKLSKLRTQKLGLMQDLLTGKVSVGVASPEPVHA